MKKVNFKEKGREIKEAFYPIQVSQINGAALRMAVIEGEYRWHIHPEEDEFFIVVDGEIQLETKSGEVTLREWEGIRVPKGTPHRTKSQKPAVVLIIEPVHTNTRGIPIEEEETE